MIAFSVASGLPSCALPDYMPGTGLGSPAGLSRSPAVLFLKRGEGYMSKRTLLVASGLICFLLGLVVGQQVARLHAQPSTVPHAAQPNTAKSPVWKLGLDLKARQGGT